MTIGQTQEKHRAQLNPCLLTDKENAKQVKWQRWVSQKRSLAGIHQEIANSGKKTQSQILDQYWEARGFFD